MASLFISASLESFPHVEVLTSRKIPSAVGEHTWTTTAHRRGHRLAGARGRSSSPAASKTWGGEQQVGLGILGFGVWGLI